MTTKFDLERNKLMETIAEHLSDIYNESYEVLETASNQYCIPVVHKDGDEGYITITFSIPKGSRDGEPYDGYVMAEEFKRKCNERAQKIAEALRKKNEKIERDRKAREEKAKLRAEKKG